MEATIVRVVDIDNGERVVAIFEDDRFNDNSFALMSNKGVIEAMERACGWEGHGSIHIPEHHHGTTMLGPSHFLGQNTLVIRAPYVQRDDGVWEENKAARARYFRITWEKRYDRGLPSVLRMLEQHKG